MKKLLRILTILFILTFLLGIGGLILAASLDNANQPRTPTQIARDITNDPTAAVAITEENVTILFVFQNTQTARQDARRIFPTLLCDLRDDGYINRAYRFVGTAMLDGINSPGISATLTAEEAAAYPCGQTGEMDFDINPLLP